MSGKMKGYTSGEGGFRGRWGQFRGGEGRGGEG